MARKRTPQTPEQKAAKAARERERYAKARAAGFNPEQARSIKKTLRDMPEVISEPTEAVIELLGSVKGAADWLLGLAQDVTKPDRPSKPPAKKPSEPKRSSGGRTSRRGGGGGGRKPTPDFDEYVRRNPGKSANDLIRDYRKAGGKIGNEKGKQRIRDVRQKKRDPRKVTRFRYYSNDEKPLFGEADRRLIKDRYMYLVQFEVEQEDAADTRTDWLYVASNRELTMREIKEHTLDIWSDGYLDGKEKYRAIRIIPESIELIHAVDTRL